MAQKRKKFAVKPSLTGAMLMLLDGKPLAALLATRLYMRGEYEASLEGPDGERGWCALSREQWVIDTGFTLTQYDRTIRFLKERGAVVARLKQVPGQGTRLWVRLHPKFKKQVKTCMDKGFVTSNKTPPVSPSEVTKPVLSDLPKPSISTIYNEGGLNEGESNEGTSEVLTDHAPSGKPSGTRAPELRVVKATEESMKEIQKYPRTNKGEQVVKGKKSLEPGEQLERKSPITNGGQLGLSKFESGWKFVHAQVYPGEILVPWTGKEKGWAKSLLSKLYGVNPKFDVPLFIGVLIGNWEDASTYVQGERGLKTRPEYPSIGYVAGSPQEFLRWFLHRDDTVQSVAQTGERYVHRPAKKKSEFRSAREIFRD